MIFTNVLEPSGAIFFYKTNVFKRAKRCDIQINRFCI
jgi:hypothetical protein